MTVKLRGKSKINGLKTEIVPEESKQRCTHFWVIERPLGPTSLGLCKYCGEVREFSNDPLGRDRPDSSVKEETFAAADINEARPHY